jgi:hypothetical protein
LGTLVILIGLVAAIGYFRGWFRMSTVDRANETNVELKIDKERVRSDKDEVKRRVRELGAQD